jgi:tryptophan 2,3-dioxygenase
MQTLSTTSGAAACPFAPQLRRQRPVARPSAPGEEAPSAAIARWLTSRIADDFPYHAVVAEFSRVGKHFVATEVLEALANVRAALPEARGSTAGVRLLDRFLDVALDKWDGRYANPTYLGLSLLPLPAADESAHDLAAVERRYDRLFAQLVADALRFEVSAADGETELLPRMRPDRATTAKRCRLGLQAAGHAARRLGLSDGVDVADPIAGARHLWTNVAADLPQAEHRVLQLSMLPVSTIHDEYQFIRVLQSFEATFALVAVQLRTAVQALTDGELALALRGIDGAEAALREAAPLWSLVATMQVEAFQAFREFTEGASAIQSRNYKLVESVCRRPDQSRLDSPAYLSVPEVRQHMLTGQVTLDEAFAAARASGRLGAGDLDELEQALRRFAATLLRWRRTHYKNAVRMLGERTGTGYTEGAPYLAAVQAIPVFLSVAPPEAVKEGGAAVISGREEVVPAATRIGLGARARCPFAAGRAADAVAVVEREEFTKL